MSEHGSPVEDGSSDVSGPKGRQLSAGQRAGLVALVGVLVLGYPDQHRAAGNQNLDRNADVPAD